jgi:hypothetical protein
MKNIILIVLTVFALNVVIAQNKGNGKGNGGGKNAVPESAVPAAVVNAFKAANAGVANVIWHKAPKKEFYRAGYTSADGMRKASIYSADGKQLRAIEIGKENLLPANITSDVKAKATGAEIKRVEKHTLLQKNNEIRYHVFAVNKEAKTRYHFRYDGTGKMLDMKQKTIGQGNGKPGDKADTNNENDDIEDVLDSID